MKQNDLQSSTSTTTLLTGTVSWNWSNIFDTSNLHTVTSQSTQSSLSTRSRHFGSRTSSSSQFDVQSSNIQLQTTSSNIFNCHLRCVWGRLITISLNLHTSSNTANGFTSGQIGNVYKCIVKG